MNRLILFSLLVTACGGGGSVYNAPVQIDTPEPRISTTAIDQPIIILATGQSNMVGQGTGGAFKVNDKVQIRHNINREFQVVDLVNEYPMTLGAPDTIGGGRNNAAVAFAHRLQEETQRPVQLILDAMNGESIVQWSGGSFSQSLVNTVHDAGVMQVDFYLWLQGERDHSVDMSEGEYSVHFQTMLDNLSDLNIVNIITAPLNTDFLINYSRNSGVNIFLKSLPSADVSGLTTFDGVHYTGSSLYELGYNRFWNVINVQ